MPKFPITVTMLLYLFDDKMLQPTMISAAAMRRLQVSHNAIGSVTIPETLFHLPSVLLNCDHSADSRNELLVDDLHFPLLLSYEIKHQKRQKLQT
jgi:hypothetical protein